MIELLSNTVSPDGMRYVKVVSDKPLTKARMLRFVPGAALEFAQVKVTPTAALSLFHGEVTYPCRGVVRCQVSSVTRVRSLVVWRIMPEEGYRLSEIIGFVAEWYFAQTHQRPGYAFVRKLPQKAVPQGDDKNGIEVDGVMLIEAEWALEKCVMVGG